MILPSQHAMTGVQELADVKVNKAIYLLSHAEVSKEEALPQDP